MPYRRTPQVMERLAKRHQAIIDAAIKLINRRGLERFEVDAVAAAAKVAIGTVYNYFATREALLQAIVRHVLESDLAAMRAEAALSSNPSTKLAFALGVFIQLQQQSPRLAAAMRALPSYRDTLVLEFAALICAAKPRLPIDEASLAAVATVGALDAMLARDIKGPILQIALATAGIERERERIIRVPA